MIKTSFLLVLLAVISCQPPRPNTDPVKPGGQGKCVGGGCKEDFRVTLTSDGHVTIDNIDKKLPTLPKPPTGEISVIDWLKGLFSPEIAVEKPVDSGSSGNPNAGSGTSDGGAGTGSGSNGTGTGSGPIVDNPIPGDPSHDRCENDPVSCGETPQGSNFENSELGKLLSGTWKGLNYSIGEITGQNSKKRKEAQALKRRYAEMEVLQDQANAIIGDMNTATNAVLGIAGDLSKGDQYNLTGETFGQTKNAVALHNRRASALDQDTNDIPEKVNIPPSKPVYDTPELKGVEQARQYRNYVSRQVEAGPVDFRPIGRHLIEVADNALDYSEAAYRAGDKEKGDFAKELAVTTLDLALSLTPGVGLMKDIYEAASGKNLLTGQPLSGFERSMAFFGVLTAGYGSKLKLVGKAAIITDIFKARKVATEATEIARATSKAAEIAEAAQKVGLKDKRVIDEIVDAVKESRPCKMAFQMKESPIQKLFGLFSGTAYAGNCIPEGGEDAVRATIESFGEEGAKALPKMTPAQVSRSTKIDNTIRDHAKPMDFEGVRKELAGEKIPRPDGGFYDHITEMAESKAGLEKSSEALKNSLKNPNLDQDVRTFLERQVGRADDVVSRMADALAGKQ